MNTSLYNLLNETVLTEGRKEDVMAKYPKVPKESIETLSQSDPSGNNKYLEWMVGQVNDGRNDLQIILDIVNKYHNNLNMVNKNNMENFVSTASNWDSSALQRVVRSPKDINSFLNLTYLNYFVDYISNVVSKNKEKEELKKETDRIYEDSDLLVISPRTHRASCEYGRHSSWCVATSTSSHFNNYTKSGTLYYFISKKDHAYNKYWKDKDDGKPPYKTALLLKDNGEASWWSKGDSNYTDGLDLDNSSLPFLTTTIKDKVLKHNKYTIENRKKREIEKMLISKGFYKRNGDNQSMQDFAGFIRSNIFTPEQIVAIIRNDNWMALYDNSESGKSLREKLGTDTIFSLLREMLTSSTDIKTLLNDINQQEFLTDFSNTLTDDQNRELGKIMVSKLGNKPTASDVGGGIKMYIDKWTMTEEQWDVYNISSSYFFIGKVEPMETGENVDGKPIFEKSLNIDKIIESDRFNPKHHHTLQMMMLKARLANASLYALVTDKDLLKQYVGEGGNEIPPNIRKIIMKNAKKLG